MNEVEKKRMQKNLLNIGKIKDMKKEKVKSFGLIYSNMCWV